jgi:hypothetical protein
MHVDRTRFQSESRATRARRSGMDLG